MWSKLNALTLWNVEMTPKLGSGHSLLPTYCALGEMYDISGITFPGKVTTRETFLELFS